MSRKTIAVFSILATAGLFSAWALHARAGNENCEPARWMGKLAMKTGMMGQGSGPGMMMRKGMMRQHEGQGGGMHRGNFIRHRQVMMGGGIAAPYAGLSNPLPVTAENIDAGKRLFADNCASCHGKGGKGDGEAGKDLNPPPADITHVLGKPLDRDDYFMWTISEGGEKLKTDMPAFKDALSEKERWQIVMYLRNGLAEGR